MQTITQLIKAGVMKYMDIPALDFKIACPQFSSTCSLSFPDAVNRYYSDKTLRDTSYCRSALYPQAEKGLIYARQNRDPFNPYEYEADFEVTCNSGCITSLYTDRYTYTGGAHGTTARDSDTWDFAAGKRLSLGDFFPGNPDYTEYILNLIQAQIPGRLRQEPASYFEDYPALLKKTFNPRSFYATPEGLVIYFQQYDITPYSTGIPEFLVPFSG